MPTTTCATATTAAPTATTTTTAMATTARRLAQVRRRPRKPQPNLRLKLGAHHRILIAHLLIGHALINTPTDDLLHAHAQ